MTTQDITLCTLPSVFRSDSASATLGNALGVKDASIINATLPTINNQVLSGNTDGTCAWITNTGAVTSLSIDPSLSTGLAISATIPIGTYSIGAVNVPTTNPNLYYLRNDGRWAQPTNAVRKSASTLIRMVNANAFTGSQWIYPISNYWSKPWDNIGITISDATLFGTSISSWSIPQGIYRATFTFQGNLYGSTGTASTANYFYFLDTSAVQSLPPANSGYTVNNGLAVYISYGQVLSNQDYIYATGSSIIDTTGEGTRSFFVSFRFDKNGSVWPDNPNTTILIEKIA